MSKATINSKTFQRQGCVLVFAIVCVLSLALTIRLGYLMIYRAEYYGGKAKEVQERERPIKAARGTIYDRNGVEMAGNKPVSTVSVIHNQVKQPEQVISILTRELGLDEEWVRKRVEKRSSIERIRANVDKETSDRIRSYEMAGVMVDEDYKRFYPYGSLASKVIGFTGGDNQGIVGLEAKYEDTLKGKDGAILTLTNAAGIEIENAAEDRLEPIAGNDLRLSLDVNIQQFAEQAAKKVMEEKQAKQVNVIMMNPQNGEIYAMVNVPEFDLNDPFTLEDGVGEGLTDKETMDLLNNRWRNYCINDSFEPGSTFKIITAASALEEDVVKLSDTFSCPGFAVVEDRRIRCHKAGGHGGETFVEGMKNSCNPVFINVGARVGVKNMFRYLDKFGVNKKTGIDLPGEGATIMHQQKNVGAVELATISFGQSFQMTPIHLATTVSAMINGGRLVVPHFGMEVLGASDGNARALEYETKDGLISEETSDTLKELLELVVSDGTGKQTYLPGYRVGAKTGTSEKLPRRSGKYIASCLAFAPADEPRMLALVLIDEPVGIYYGGTVAAPVVAQLLSNALPYVGVEPEYTDRDREEYGVGTITVGNFVGKARAEAEEEAKKYGFGDVRCIGEGEMVTEQFPPAGETVNVNGNLILYFK